MESALVCHAGKYEEKTRPQSTGAASPLRATTVRHSSDSNGSSSDAIAAQALKYQQLMEPNQGVIAINPQVIRLSHFKNRSNRSLSESDPQFVATRESIRTHGQDTPIWVYQLGPEAAPFEYELVAGRRRHAACMALGIPVLALLKTVSSDMDCALMMFRENADRQNLSPLEYGRMFQDWLDKKIFSSQKEIAAKVNRDNSVIARYIRLAALPDIVLAAFEDDREIKLRWCDQLTEAVSKRPEAVFRLAAQLKNLPQRKAIEVFDALVNTASEKPGKRSSRRSHTQQQESIEVGGRVPLKIGYGKHKLVLQTQHLNEEQEGAFLRGVAEYAERSLRELLNRRSVHDRDN